MFGDPVVRLWMALYGLARSGFDWGDHIVKALLEIETTKDILGMHVNITTDDRGMRAVRLRQDDCTCTLIGKYLDSPDASALAGGRRELCQNAPKHISGGRKLCPNAPRHVIER